VVTSDDLAATLGLPGAAITMRSGVAERRYAAPGVGPSDLAREAGLAALTAAGLEPADIDLLVFATMTPDITFPGPGCFLQDKLACRTVGALDIRAQCAGFLFALAVADRFIRAGTATRVLVAGAEVHSTALDQSPRGQDVTPYFGDGGGAVLLGAAAAPGVVGAALHSDPTGLERFWCEFPSSRHFPERMTREHLRAGRHYCVLDLDALNPQAERALALVTREVLERADVAPEHVALTLMHYIDPRVARRAGEVAGIPPDRIVATSEAAGHIAAGGIPIALADAIASGRVGQGDLVCCAAFGAGISWAGVLLRL
jgi:3-oxoacyl-[acyl-carrier-protein] synthase-3